MSTEAVFEGAVHPHTRSDVYFNEMAWIEKFRG